MTIEAITNREPVAYASSKEWRKNHIMSAAQYKSALPKNVVDFDIPLYATLPDEALERSEQATFDIAARLLKERDALASRISQQDAELDRMRRELEEARDEIERLNLSIVTARNNAGSTYQAAQAAIVEARKAAFIEAAEMIEDMVDDDCFPLSDRNRIAAPLRAKAEETDRG